MNQEERRVYLIQYLLNEDSQYEDISIPHNALDQKKLLRALMNVRIPKSISNQFITVQDAYLKEEINKKGIVSIDNLDEIQKDLYVWQGDITMKSILTLLQKSLLMNMHWSTLLTQLKRYVVQLGIQSKNCLSYL